MKSQDIVLLLKLVSLQEQESHLQANQREKNWPHDWGDWNDWEEENIPELDDYRNQEQIEARYTSRALAQETGISKSQVHLSIKRCYEVGLAKQDRRMNVPRVNRKALDEFISYGLKYVFPVKPGTLTRGIATAFAAPVFSKKLMSAGELPLIWPDPRGKTKGLAIEPLYKSVTFAVRRDPEMYALLALVDAIRVGQPREANLAKKMLKEKLGIQ